MFLESYDDTAHVAAYGHLLKCYDNFPCRARAKGGGGVMKSQSGCCALPCHVPMGTFFLPSFWVWVLGFLVCSILASGMGLGGGGMESQNLVPCRAMGGGL